MSIKGALFLFTFTVAPYLVRCQNEFIEPIFIHQFDTIDGSIYARKVELRDVINRGTQTGFCYGNIGLVMQVFISKGKAEFKTIKHNERNYFLETATIIFANDSLVKDGDFIYKYASNNSDTASVVTYKKGIVIKIVGFDHKNNRIRSQYYNSRGLLNGPYHVYDTSNGYFVKGAYHSGGPSGSWSFYDKMGNLTAIGSFGNMEYIDTISGCSRLCLPIHFSIYNKIHIKRGKWLYYENGNIVCTVRYSREGFVRRINMKKSVYDLKESDRIFYHVYYGSHLSR